MGIDTIDEFLPYLGDLLLVRAPTPPLQASRGVTGKNHRPTLDAQRCCKHLQDTFKGDGGIAGIAEEVGNLL
jgi:hypothetical protein